MTHTQLNSILDRAGSQFVSVTFTKANGEARQLTFNPRHIGPITGTGSTCSDPNVFRVVDAGIQQWRSFRADRVIQIKVGGQVSS